MDAITAEASSDYDLRRLLSTALQEATQWREIADHWRDVCDALRAAPESSSAEPDGASNRLIEAKQAEIASLTRKNVEYQRENAQLATRLEQAEDRRANHENELAGVRALLDDARRELDGLRRRDMQGAARIAAERLRQVTEEGYSAEHDDDETDGQLADAAAWYAAEGAFDEEGKSLWPWSDKNKPPNNDRQRDMEIAGALCAAEWDRLERLRVASHHVAPEAAA